MKIAHVFTSFSEHAASLRLAEIAKAGRGLDHHVIALDDDLSAMASMPAGFAGEGYGARRAGPDRLGLRQRLAACGADLLCTYGFGALDAALANAAGPGLPHIHHEDDPIDEEAAFRQGPRLRSVAAAGGVIVVSSPAAERYARTRWRIPAQSLRAILPGVDRRRFRRPAGGRAEEGALVTFGFIGPLTESRTLGDLVKAFAGMRARSAARLAIHGEGPARPQMEGLARAHGARSEIFFRGAPAATDRLYDEFDAFLVLGSERDAGQRLLEAMASGLPVVAQAQSAAAEFLAPENRPLVVTAGDLQQLTLALARIVNDYGLRQRAGLANEMRARGEFSLGKMTSAYHGLYHETVR